VCLHVCKVSPSRISPSLFFLISAIQKEMDEMRHGKGKKNGKEKKNVK
jgi:hypothetical protein